jgi:PBP1b-binding outer membrane lipoprotein LpoB
VLQRLLNFPQTVMQSLQNQVLQNQAITKKTKDLIDKLLLGKFSFAEIAKIVGVSEQWLQGYVNFK